MGLDPNRPISKHELLQVEGNRNLNPSMASQEVDVEAVEEVLATPQLEERVETNVQERPDVEVPNPEPKKLPVVTAKPQKKAEPKKPKNALKELPKAAKSGSTKKKKEPS